jgi:hypothetical protein
MQKGSLIRSSRRQGPDVWEYRWRESCSGKTRRHRRIVIGTINTRQRELAEDKEWKTLSTRVTYEGYLRKWIVPRWGATNLSAIRAVEVELWLRTLPLARASRAKIRNLMSVPLTTRDDTILFTATPSPSSAKARSGGQHQKCFCLPKLADSLAVCETERGLLFSWPRVRGFA